MAKWAVVAIPKKDDYIWSISSEKIPHCTLLFLGEQEDGTPNADISDFIGYVSRLTLPIFGLYVERRGVLGPDDADVLFFEKQSTKNLEEYRNYLLTNQDISKMYNSTEQYPNWTPHLTLGYPESPAKKDDRDYPGIYYVDFDKIALWTGDFEGPEFELRRRNFYTEELAMSATKFSDLPELSHHGIKGMKWGVRRSPAQLAKARPESKDYKTSRALKAKTTKSLSNEEIKTVVKRLELEKRLKDLDPSIATKGNKALKTTIGLVGSVSALVAAGNTPVGRTVKNAAKTAVNKLKK